LALTCPARANLLLNGDFSDGSTGFSTDYSPVATDGTVHTNPGNDAVIGNPAPAFTNGYLSYGDHTSGAGLMLFVDGSSSANAFWQEATPSLNAGTAYTFTYYVTGADAISLPDVQVLVNGAAIDPGFQVTGAGGGSQWQEVVDTFMTGSAGAYTIALVDLNTTAYGNDFTVDDLSLTGPISMPVSEPGSFGLLFVGAAVAGACCLRRKPALF
jgi:hypothetical protein